MKKIIKHVLGLVIIPSVFASLTSFGSAYGYSYQIAAQCSIYNRKAI